MMFDASQFIREVPGAPGYYVTVTGDVYSTTRGTWHKMSLCDNGDGYLIVSCGARRVQAHRIVLEAFVGPAPGEPPMIQARHLDGCRTNNRLDNLAWGTARLNFEDRVRHGKQYVGEKHGRALFTDEQIRQIRADWKAGKWRTMREAAEEYGVQYGTMAAILAGRTWKQLL